MGLLGNDGIYATVYDLIKDDWKPKQNYDDEAGYHKDLFESLNSKSSGKYPITNENGRSLCDIAVGRNVGIEIKFNLMHKKDADRLIGQVGRYMDDYSEGVIVVLCGKTDLSHLNDLRTELRKVQSRYESSGILGQSAEKIIGLIDK